MRTRPFIAARLEERFDRRLEHILRAMGWQEQVIYYTGYGSSKFARVIGRVVLARKHSETGFDKVFDDFARRRGFRNFITVPCVRAKYTIKLPGVTIESVTDRGGYIDYRVRDHGLPPGWQKAAIQCGASKTVQAPINIIPDGQTFGLISDIDDTVIATSLPRLFIAAWNSFIRDEFVRQAIPGMAQLFRTVTGERGDAPVFYVSTGAWNTQPFLVRFLKKHRFPPGPTLLTDWGPTNTGFFRSGAAHKSNSLLQLNQDFPNISWLLVGDNGQRDPAIYSDFIRIAPERVRAVAIRQLSATEQVLAHGTPDILEDSRSADVEIPWVEGPDGRSLLRQ
ncbi:MAG: DUF2183 domain-containing protein, partial [Propionibacteriaceae bacterium]|nr:DUF2183 domain-containing protein [Propionibacteriaceae bacterium]